MSITEARKKVNLAQANYNEYAKLAEAARKTLHEAEDVLAAEVCPYAVGTVMVNRDGKRARITKIKRGSYTDYTLHGVNIKKDGTEGVERVLSSWNGWKPEAANG